MQLPYPPPISDATGFAAPECWKAQARAHKLLGLNRKASLALAEEGGASYRELLQLSLGWAPGPSYRCRELHQQAREGHIREVLQVAEAWGIAPLSIALWETVRIRMLPVSLGLPSPERALMRTCTKQDPWRGGLQWLHEPPSGLHRLPEGLALREAHLGGPMVGRLPARFTVDRELRLDDTDLVKLPEAVAAHRSHLTLRDWRRLETLPELTAPSRVELDSLPIDGPLRLRDGAHLVLRNLPYLRNLRVESPLGSLEIAHCRALHTFPSRIRGNLILRDCPDLRELPADLHVEGNLRVESCHGLRALPQGLTVGGDVSLAHCSALTELPADWRVPGALELQDLPALLTLPPGLEVVDHLLLWETAQPPFRLPEDRPLPVRRVRTRGGSVHIWPGMRRQSPYPLERW